MNYPKELPERFSLKARQVFTPEGVLDNAFVHIDQGEITSVNESLIEGYSLFDIGERKLMPGLIDLHIHGYAGVDIMDATPESICEMAQELAKNGVTGFLGTTVTARWDHILSALRNIRQCIYNDMDTRGAELLGSYLEGPFFTPKHKGAHPERLFVAPTEDRLTELLTVSGGTLKVVALAPEVNKAVDATQQLVDNGVQVAMGHSDANYDQAVACIDAGARIAVHLFNGMSGLHHREPGCVGAFLSHDKVTSELIADGVHLHPAILNLSWKCKGSDQAVLITDCMCAGGLSDGEYQLGELPVIVKEGVARTESGSLAGSTLTLNSAVRNMVRVAKIPEIDAIRMATEIPAKLIGSDQTIGVIAPGRKANLVVMDDDYNVELTLVKGQPVYIKKSELN
ncbi:N-acetylglucosamine-6-phosphate deacetylase [Endozoicomonas sp. (ex Bugula neritina AB1)]|nr:N-acetylglucosamine-6-phosphate deacetylase [Endozoicomonas sp. (ex Bugula neritina AB1)]